MEYNCPYRVTLYRSEGFSGPFSKIGGPFLPEVISVEDLLGKKTRPYYYAVEVDLGEAQVRFPRIGGITLSADLIPLAKEALRKTIRSIRISRGRKILYYPTRTSGPYCSCFDRVNGRWDKACRSCFGTKFQAGFYNPLVLHAAIVAGQVQDSGKDSPTSAIIPAISMARKGDVVVERENRRWIVGEISVGEYARVPVRQTLQLLPLDSSSVLQELPVDFSLLGIDEVAR